MKVDELLTQVSAASGVTKKDSSAVLKATLNAISEAVASKDRITFPGFGTFSAQERKARKAFNPRTRQPLKVPARTVPHFSAGKSLKEAANK